MEIRKINRKRIYEDIAEQLEEILANGELKPGDKFFSENELAAMFDVSRTTIRQALTILEIKGIVERKQGSATFLSEYKETEKISIDSANGGNELLVTNMINVMSNVPKNILSEPMELRMIMEPNIAYLAARRADSNAIETLEECISRQAKMVQENKLSIEEDSAFHFAIAKAANNSMLLVMVKTLHELLKDSRTISHTGAAASKSSLDSHTKILDAIKNHDAQKAYDLMREHLLRVERLIMLNNDFSAIDIGNRD